MADEVIQSIEDTLANFQSAGANSARLRADLQVEDWGGSNDRFWGFKNSGDNDAVHVCAKQYSYDGDKTYAKNEFGRTKFLASSGTSEYQIVMNETTNDHDLGIGIMENDDILITSSDLDYNHNIRIGDGAGFNSSFDKMGVLAIGSSSARSVHGTLDSSNLYGVGAGQYADNLVYCNLSGFEAGMSSVTNSSSLDAFGYKAGYDFEGNESAFYAFQAGMNASGTALLGIGKKSLYNAQCDGVEAMGKESGMNSTGDSCGYLFYRAGRDNVGSGCLFIGRSTGEGNTQNNQLLVGHGITAGSSNVVILGNPTNQDNTRLPAVHLNSDSNKKVSELTEAVPAYIASDGTLIAMDDLS